MKREWEPGEVALVTWKALDRLRTEMRFRAERDGVGAVWIGADGSWIGDATARDARPLVVIDPEDREQAARLIALFSDQFTSWSTDGERDADKMQAALRELANPTPPKPDEPQGLGAVVEDADGRKWVAGPGLPLGRRWEPEWAGDCEYYSKIAAVRILSEGVQP